MSSYNHIDPESSRQGHVSKSNSNSNYDSSEAVKYYRFVMFCVPIFFALTLLFLFYLFYRRVNWSSDRMRNTSSSHNNFPFSTEEEVRLGLRKEVREMLPIIIYRESFSVKDSQCSVCLGDYEAEDRLQQMPACGHTFHIDCIDNWLATHTTCPLCRLSLFSSAKSPPIELPDVHEPNNQLSLAAENGCSSSFEQTSQPSPLSAVELRAIDTTTVEGNSGKLCCFDRETEHLECKREERNP